MPGLLSYAGAGLLKGGGDALSEQYTAEVKAKRAAALEGLKQDHQRSLLNTRIAADDERQLRDIDARAALADDANESREFIADGANASRERISAANNASREKLVTATNDLKTELAKGAAASREKIAKLEAELREKLSKAGEAGKDKRQKAALKSAADLLGIREKGAGARNDATIAGADKRNTDAIAGRKGLLTDTLKSRESEGEKNRKSREAIAVDRTVSNEIIAGVRGRSKDRSAAEKRAFDLEVEINTTTDDLGEETTDWNAVADGLQARGFKGVARSARKRGRAIQDKEDTAIAEAQADREVKEKAGTLSSDASDFKEDGGSRDQFRARRIREIEAKLRKDRGGLRGSGTAKKTQKFDVGTNPPANGRRTKLRARGDTEGAGATGAPEEQKQQFYVGDEPPAAYPDARKFSDGYWYLKRGDQNYRVLKNDAVPEITGTDAEMREQLSKLKVGQRVLVRGKAVEKIEGGFKPVGSR